MLSGACRKTCGTKAAAAPAFSSGQQEREHDENGSRTFVGDSIVLRATYGVGHPYLHLLEAERTDGVGVLLLQVARQLATVLLLRVAAKDGLLLGSYRKHGEPYPAAGRAPTTSPRLAKAKLRGFN